MGIQCIYLQNTEFNDLEGFQICTFITDYKIKKIHTIIKEIIVLQEIFARMPTDDEVCERLGMFVDKYRDYKKLSYFYELYSELF